MMQRLMNASGAAALVVSLLALVVSAGGLASAARPGHHGGKARRHAKARRPARPPVRYAPLARNGRIPGRYLPPKVGRAHNSDLLNGHTADSLAPSCPQTSVDIGTWCLMTSPYPLTNADQGKNDYFFATKACADMGGYLPTAAQLIGAASYVKLASTIDDSPLTATTDLDPSDGLKDRREMSGTLITTAAGGSAAGSEGVTRGSRGDPKQGEPDPAPVPANPAPETLQYITVYDNHEHGGFAGGEPVSKPENFRCAFNKVPGAISVGG